jgi:hypothetical protein
MKSALLDDAVFPVGNLLVSIRRGELYAVAFVGPFRFSVKRRLAQESGGKGGTPTPGVCTKECGSA